MKPQPGPSIVSLIASATEIVCALGLREHLVGISHECDFPADVRELPVLSEPRVDPSQPGGAIDRAVRELVRDGLSVYRVRTDLLEALRPDLIVTQDQCEVCAVSLKDVEAALSRVTLKSTRICSLRPQSLEEVEADFRRVGEASGVPERAEDLVMRFRGGLQAVRQAVAASQERPSVACLEWLDPLMAAGGWMPQLVEIAGGRPTLVTEPKRFRAVTWEELEASDPDIVVVMPCGFPIERTQQELSGRSIGGPLHRLRATRQGRCFIADGNAYFNRPGPRIADSARILAGLLHPDCVRPVLGAMPWP